MLRQFIGRAFLMMMVVGAFACNSKNDGLKASEVLSNPLDSAKAAEAPVITFEKMEYDFGNVIDGEVVKYAFKFKNTGKSPLIITGASASCGCTVPEFPKDPVPVGGEGNIDVQFNSEGRVGPVNKLIFVTSNSNPSRTELTIKGEVEPKK